MANLLSPAQHEHQPNWSMRQNSYWEKTEATWPLEANLHKQKAAKCYRQISRHPMVAEPIAYKKSKLFAAPVTWTWKLKYQNISASTWLACPYGQGNYLHSFHFSLEKGQIWEEGWKNTAYKKSNAFSQSLKTFKYILPWKDIKQYDHRPC